MQVVQKAGSVAKVVVSPLTKLGNKIHTNAVRRNKDMPEDWRQVVAQHNAQGTDLATLTTVEFIEKQFKLIPYRIERCKFEADYAIANCCKFSNYSYKDWIFEIRFLVRLVFIYLMCVLIGRQSIMPLIEPGSPFLEQIKYNNPNW